MWDVIINTMILLIGYFIAIFAVFYKLVIEKKDSFNSQRKIRINRIIIIIVSVLGIILGGYKIINDRTKEQAMNIQNLSNQTTIEQLSKKVTNDSVQIHALFDTLRIQFGIIRNDKTKQLIQYNTNIKNAERVDIGR